MAACFLDFIVLSSLKDSWYIAYSLLLQAFCYSHLAKWWWNGSQLDTLEHRTFQSCFSYQLFLSILLLLSLLLMFKLLFWICKDINNILNTNELHLLFPPNKLCLTYWFSDTWRAISLCISQSLHWYQFRFADGTPHCPKDTREQSSTSCVPLWWNPCGKWRISPTLLSGSRVE